MKLFNLTGLIVDTGLDKQNFQSKIVNIFLPINFNICFGCSKEPSHLDGSFEHPQHMFWLRNKKLNFSDALLTKVLVDVAFTNQNELGVCLQEHIGLLGMVW